MQIFRPSKVYQDFKCAFVGKLVGLLEGIMGNTLYDCPPLNARHLDAVMIKSFGTLDYAHKKGVFHLDFRARNVIVSFIGAGRGELKIMVTDWGCGTKKEEEFTFRGTVPYAHDQLVKSQTTGKRSPKPDHDWASLAYTFFQCSTKTCPWICDHSMARNKTDHGWLKGRRENVQVWWEGLVKKDLPTELQDAIVKGAMLQTKKREASASPPQKQGGKRYKEESKSTRKK